MWRWLILLLAVVILYKLITNERNRKTKDQDKAKERRIQKGELVKDPVCGAYVEAEGSITVRDGQKVHKFCGYDCRDRFLEELEAGGRELPERNKTEDD